MDVEVVPEKGQGTKRDRFNSDESDASDTKKMKPPMNKEQAMTIFSEKFSPGRTMTREDWNTRIGTILIQEGLLPPDTEKTEQDSAIIALAELIQSGEIKPELFMKSIEQFKKMRSEKSGGRNKQRGGKDCNKTDYAILVAMMAVLYWTGAIPAAATVAYNTVSTQVGIVTSYMPGIDTIMDKMGLCMTYFSTFIPSAFPGDELAYAVGTVANTFVRKVGEMLIILAEAANLSLKMGFSVGAKTIWDTTINWVKDNPTYVLAGYAGKKALDWRKDAQELKRIKDAEAAPKALTSEQVKTYKKVFGDIIYRIRDLLCDLTDLIRNGAATAADISAVGIAKMRSPSDATTATATTGTNTDDDPDSIEEIKKDLTLLEGLADAAAAAEPLAEPFAEPLASGGKRSTRKRNSRTRKSKSRKPKKRKSSGRKAKKASRKMKSRNGRKTRRRGSKKR